MRHLTLLAVLALSACAGRVSPESFLQPQVDLRQVAVRNLGLAGGTLELTLAFANPNHLALRGTALTAGLDLQGAHFGDIALGDEFALAAGDTTLLQVPLTFRWSGVAGAARGILDYGAVDYALKGNIAVNTPLGRAVSVPFSRQGNVPVLQPGLLPTH